jgi:flagellar hook assembly protein FlgD
MTLFLNPFNPSTATRFSTPTDEKVRLEIFDIRGRLVNSLIDSEHMSAGTYESIWDGKNNIGGAVASGVYIARITTGNYVNSIKMNLVK